MTFPLKFVVASNLLTAVIVWAACTGPVDAVEPAVEPTVEVEPAPVKTGIIEYFTMPRCGPCIKFKNSGAIKELEAQGWTVVKLEDGKMAPTFTVWVDGKSASFVGFSSKTNFFRTLKSKMKELENANRN